MSIFDCLERSKNFLLHYKQRCAVWSKKLKIKLIKGIINLNCSVGSLLLCDWNHEYTLMDGNNRLLTCDEFRRNKFGVDLSGNGELIYYDSLTEEQKMRFLSYTLIIEKVLCSPEDASIHFVLRNTTGKQLSNGALIWSVFDEPRLQSYREIMEQLIPEFYNIWSIMDKHTFLNEISKDYSRCTFAKQDQCSHKLANTIDTLSSIISFTLNGNKEVSSKELASNDEDLRTQLTPQKINDIVKILNRVSQIISTENIVRKGIFKLRGLTSIIIKYINNHTDNYWRRVVQVMNTNDGVNFMNNEILGHLKGKPLCNTILQERYNKLKDYVDTVVM